MPDSLLAEPGEIAVGQDTYRQVHGLFQWQAAGSVGLRGKSAQVTAYRLLEARADRRDPAERRPLRAGSSPLVGRRAELDACCHVLARLAQGEGSLLLLTGDAGVGKSRLLAEARQKALEQGLAWLEGRCLSCGPIRSYWPLLEIIEQAAGIDSNDSEADAWTKLSARVTDLFDLDTPQILPSLATLLSLSAPAGEYQAEAEAGEDLGNRLCQAVRLFFARLAEKQPLVLVIEDVQCLDASSAALLEHLVPLTGETSILVCLTARTGPGDTLQRLDELAGKGHGRRSRLIRLQPLSVPETAQLACNLMQMEELPARLRDTILAKAEGNPLFVEEVVHGLIEVGAVRRDSATGGWEVSEQASGLPIPDTLRGVIMARVDRLDDDVKQVLRTASVIGRSFPYRVLAAVAGAPRDLRACLQDLQARELVREKARDPELEYLFAHALVQEVIYESILLQRRRVLHGRVAAVIKDLFADRIEQFLALLAYHYSNAQEWEKAQEYLFRAGEQAGRMAADVEASELYDQAVEAYLRVARTVLVGGVREKLAAAIHGAYVRDNEGLLPPADPRLRSWDQLPETYREANRRQADEFPAYLARAGCGLLPVEDESPRRIDFAPSEVERLAELEHERWWAQKRAAGYTWGPQRGELEKVHPSLVPWDELTEQEREKDRQAVRNIPFRLAATGFETYRLGGAGRGRPAACRVSAAEESGS